MNCTLYRYARVSLAALLLLPSLTWAQQAAPGASDALDEIVVTARKRSEALSKVPEAVSVVTADALEEKNITNLDQVQGSVPSFSFLQLQDPSVVYISVRGINSVRNSENPVAMVIDGVQTNDPSQINQQLFDLEQIEILKGPQGSLYGRNAIGGAINIRTKRPTNAYSGELKATYENGNELDYSGSFSGPIIDSVLLFRLGGSHHKYDGLIKDVTTNKPVDFSGDESYFGKLYYSANELNMELRASHFRSRSGAYYYKYVGLNDINHEQNYPLDLSTPGLSALEDDEISAKIEYTTHGVKFTSVTGWSSNSNVLDGELFFRTTQPGQLAESFINRAINEDIKLTSDSEGPLQWVAGAYFLHKHQDACSPVYLGSDFVPGAVQPRSLGITLEGLCTEYRAPGTFLLRLSQFGFADQAFAGYGQGNYDFSDRFQLTLGARYDTEHHTATNPGTLYNGGGLGTAVVAPAASDIAHYRALDFSALQPKVTFSYKPGPEQMIYATVSRGFRSGGFNNTINPVFATYPAEKLTNYEVGFKSAWLGGKLRSEGAIFYEDDKNRPDFWYSATDATQNIFPIAHARVEGIEASLFARPFTGLTLTASGTLMNSRILAIDTKNIVYTPPIQIPSIGNHLSYLYHDQASLSASYQRRITREVTAIVGLDYSLKARNWFWYTNSQLEQAPVQLVNGQLSLQFANFKTRLFVENMFNRSYVTEHYPYYAGGYPQDLGYPAPPRRFGVTVSYAF